ncbi:MAG: tetratricopeptide repeat protein [Deltaproteobacteria bacterium]|nr:tetratricopeptide repeat protein [Deltaproteobacteria bacterium]
MNAKYSFFSSWCCILSFLLASTATQAAEDLFHKAQKYESEQQWSEAYSVYTEILHRDPNNAQTHYRLGTVNAKLGALDSALRSYKEALRLNPGFGEARTALEGYYTNLGITQRRNNRLDDAMQSFREALSYNASSANAHFEFAQTLEQRGQTSEAIPEYQEAIRLDPSKSAAHASVAKAYAAQGQHEQAAHAYQEVLRLNPEDPAAYHGLGVAYYDLGRKEQALTALQQAVRFYLLAGQRDKAQPAYDLQKRLMAERSSPPPPSSKPKKK